MKKLISTALLARLEAQVDTHISDAIALFQNQNDDFLNRPSASGGWSIAQCLEHLNSYGVYYLPRMSAKIEDAPEGGSAYFESSWLGSYFIKMMDPDTGKQKYKAFKGHIPASKLNAAEVVGEFISQQEELLILLRKARKTDLNKAKVGISIFPLIKLKMGDAFQFLIAHNERHMRQAKRNLPVNATPPDPVR